MNLNIEINDICLRFTIVFLYFLQLYETLLVELNNYKQCSLYIKKNNKI